MLMKLMQTTAIISFVVALGLSPATAHQQGKKLHLADAPLDQQIEAINYCQGVYRIVTKQGEPVEYPEFDLRFKTDSSEDGPKPGTAVLTNAGMRGDRGFVIFSSPEILTTYLKTSC
jgi:cytochrome c